MMKWIKRIAATLVVIILLCVAGIYIASELRRTKTYDVALTDFDAKRFQFEPGEAERRARSMMCLGCHGQAGRTIFQADYVGRLVAPNLTRKIPEYTDAELERLIRRGIKKDGTAVVAMPAATYANLADEDVAAIVTYMRSRALLPDEEKNPLEWGPLGRVALATNQIPYEADHVTNFNPPKLRPADQGRYIADTICLHCHYLDRDRDNGFGMKVPPLAAMALAYTPDEFKALLNTGIGKGGRDLGLMTEEAKGSFSHLSDTEKQALYDYLAKQP